MIIFILRRFLLLLLTMVLVSMAVFIIAESSPGNIAKNVLGAFITPEQEASFLIQNGLDKPMVVRYMYWVAGNDWIARRKLDMPLKKITTEKGFDEWWAIKKDQSLVYWKVDGDDLIAINLLPDGSRKKVKDNQRWKTIDGGKQEFWGLDNQNHAVRWV